MLAATSEHKDTNYLQVSTQENPLLALVSINHSLQKYCILSKAPKEVVEELKNKLEKLEFDQEKIEEQIRMLSSN